MPTTYGFSGLTSHSDSYVSQEVSAEVHRAYVQSSSRCLDGIVHEVLVTGKGKPCILLGIIKERSDRRAAEYLQEKLPVELAKVLKEKHILSTTTHSALYDAFLKVCAKYKAMSAYSDSIFAYTSTTAVLLDVKAGTVTRVHFGESAVGALVLDSEGQLCHPTSSSQHYTDHKLVYEDSFSCAPEQHSVVLGSPGLWQYIHPAKAGLHARAYGAAHPSLSTEDHQHDPASAIVHAALRTIVGRLAASPSPRSAVLNCLPQLDRLPPGSKQESQRTSLVPRRRGDIHPDLTAAVLQFSLTLPPASGGKPTRRCHMQHSSRVSHPISNAAVAFSNSIGKLFRSRSRPELYASCSHRQGSTGRLEATRTGLSQSTCCLASPMSPTAPSPRSGAPSSSQAGRTPAEAAVDAAGALSGDLYTEHSSSSVQRGTLEHTRRWQLLQTHVSTMSQENSLRRQLWGSAVSLALSQHTAGDSTGNLGTMEGEASDALSEREGNKATAHRSSDSSSRSSASGGSETPKSSHATSLEGALQEDSLVRSLNSNFEDLRTGSDSARAW